jgi:putative ATPase
MRPLRADPSALLQAVAAHQAAQFIGMPEVEVVLAQAVVYMALAPKSVDIYTASSAVAAHIRNAPNEPVPMHIRNAPTKLMKDTGHGQGYIYPPSHDHVVKPQSYLPQSMEGVRFWRASK